MQHYKVKVEMRQYDDTFRMIRAQSFKLVGSRMKYQIKNLNTPELT